MNMKYRSTRSTGGEAYSSAYVIKNGIADDGGLFVPQYMPTVSAEDIKNMCGMTYAERAAFILGLFLTDYSGDELLSAAEAAYSHKSFGEYPAPVSVLGDSGISVLELWHGPTAAFKDMALQIMPHLLSSSLSKTGETRDALILVATSGDTGKAALEGFSDVPRTNIHVFYPCDGVSDMQKLQMVTTEGDNVRVTAVRGNFDDCQNGVKKIFADEKMINGLGEKGLFLSSANSINFGRLVPQTVYYFSAYCDLVSGGVIKQGDILDVTVPTGNFGNILACLMAKRMGLPIGTAVCASNKNRVLTDFFETGVYDRRREFYTTASPSMDILISSNLERLLFYAAGAKKTRQYMQELSENGIFKVDDDIMQILRRDIYALSADERECFGAIRETFDSYGYLCDTHTAVAMHCAKKYKKGNTAMLVASTASPYKFAPAVLEALGQDVADRAEAPRILSALTGTEIPECLSAAEKKQIRFSEVIDPCEMPRAVADRQMLSRQCRRLSF